MGQFDSTIQTRVLQIVGASLGGVPGHVPNGGGSRNHHVHSSTCSHHHQGNSQIGSIPLGLGTLGLSIVVMMDNTLHRKLQVDTKLCVLGEGEEVLSTSSDTSKIPCTLIPKRPVFKRDWTSDFKLKIC